MIIYLVILFILTMLLCIIFNKEQKNIESFNNINKEDTYTAIIIEPREHKALEFVLSNFLQNLSTKWNFIIFHGNKNTLHYFMEIKAPSTISRK